MSDERKLYSKCDNLTLVETIKHGVIDQHHKTMDYKLWTL